MELEELRKEIDEIDREILRLLEKRVEVARKIGEIKRREGKGVVDESREREVVNRAGRFASVFREIVRVCRAEQLTVGIVGYGRIGRVLGSSISRYFNTEILTKERELSTCTSLEELVERSNVILLCTPEEATLDILQRLLEMKEKLKGKVVADVLTFKRRVRDIYARFPEYVGVCSIHPMFGEGARSAEGRRFIVVKVRNDIPQEIIEVLRAMKCEIVVVESIEEHDEIVKLVVGLPYSIAISYINFLASKGSKVFSCFGTSAKFLEVYAGAVLNDRDEFIKHVVEESRDVVEEFAELLRKGSADVEKAREVIPQEKVERYYAAFYEVLEKVRETSCKN
jgi:prephenate dehydrogenase/chorismate mutase